jgi:hypothetical protein
VPLTTFQAALAELLAVNRSHDSYLAGGAAMHIEPNSKRTSNDLDYFHDSEERVATAFANDNELLLQAGYQVETLMRQPGFVRALVRKNDDATKVEWAHDSAWRFLPTLRSQRSGFQLNPIDLAVLCWAATGKDPGFTPAMLLDLLRRRGKYRPEDFARLDLVEPVDLPALKSRWLAALADAECFFATRDPGELGCLYYSPERKTFVQPTAGEKVVPHFGRPGGVLPAIS